MTNKDKILKAVENISDDKAKEILEFLGHKESKRYIPELNENYYFILSSGDISGSRYVESSIDLSRLSQGNVFKTEEEAQFESDKRAFNTKAYWDFADNSDELDWSNSTKYKHSLVIKHSNNVVEIDTSYDYQTQGVLYTTNREWLEQWIKDNVSDIKKFWFNKKGE